MLAFLLGLLKIIGIVLLALLVILLVLVVLVLLVPIKYHAVGVLADDEKRANADITWLCRFIKLKINYLFPEKPVISLKIMGFELFKDNDKTKKNVKVPKELKKLKKMNISSSKKTKKKKKEKYHSTINADLLEVSDAENMNNEVVDRDDILREPDNNRLNDDVLETANNSFSENKIEKILFKIQELYDKIINVIDNINYYLDIWEQEDTQSLLKEARGALTKIVISIKPKAYQLDCLFGFETPDTTGRVYGYYCMLLPWLGDNVNVEPDFEQKRINADGYVKGKILVLTVLINALHILFDKRLMPLINKLKNGGK